MKKVLIGAFLAGLLLATPVMGQENPQAYFALRYDLDATAITYCRCEGVDGNPFGAPMPVEYLVDNGGSSTAVTSATAGQPVFAGMARGDVIFISIGGVLYPRGIVTYTDSENIVVDEAIDLSAADYPITWKKNNCGTAVTSGWISTAGLEQATVGFFVKQFVGDTNGLDVRIEGTVVTADGTTNVVQLWPSGKTVAGAATVQSFSTGGVDPTAGITSNLFVNITAAVQEVRVGMFHNTADDGNDLTTNAEEITVILFGLRK